MAVDEGSVIQAGGVLAFAGVVLLTLRKIEPVMASVLAELTEMRITFAAWLERERIRDERRKRETMQPPNRPHNKMPSVLPAPPPRGEFDVEESTDIKVITERLRAEAKRSGFRAPRKGTHHDSED